MELYDYILSDDTYKIRLLLGFLKRSCTARKVDVHPGREHESTGFRAMVNPLGRIPVLVDGAVVLHEPQAILTYLALQYDPERKWLPPEPAIAGRIAEMLGFAGRDLAPLSALRMAELTDGTLETSRAEAGRAEAREASVRALMILEDHLAGRELHGEKWLAAGHPTIADLAIFPPVALAPDAGLSLVPYPAIWRWIERLRHLPGFVVMPGIFAVFPEI